MELVHGVKCLLEGSGQEKFLNLIEFHSKYLEWESLRTNFGRRLGNFKPLGFLYC